MHFNGDIETIKEAINDYLAFFAREGCTEIRKKSVHQISDFMLKNDIDPAIREAIFVALLRYPVVYDRQISSKLLQYNAPRAIHHFGLKGGEQNYRQVINLCTLALDKLDSNDDYEIIQVANTARAEAELELNFNEERGFFANLFRRLKRCWISGWTGFFSPNLPTYVIQASTAVEQDATVITNKGQKPRPPFLNRNLI